jgi:protein-L-isoaspartate(D-aspartate) O-methyltransferase
MPDYRRAREQMVEFQMARRGIRDAGVLEALRQVPREEFVDPGFEEFAYDDGPLPIGANQTISQPYIVALMIEAAQLQPTDRVLEVGAGSGYAAAVMSRIAARVYAIERHAQLVEAARRRLERLGYKNIELRVGDGTRGWPEAAPFAAILVAAGGPEVPATLKEELAIGGRLIIPVGLQQFHQTLRKVTRLSETQYGEDDLGCVAFVPLIGEQGWPEDGRRSASNHVSRSL